MKWISFYSPEIWKENYWLKVDAYYAQNWHMFDMPVHRHNDVEIMYVMKGNCTVVVFENIDTNNLDSPLRVQEVIKLKAGKLIMLDTGVWHKLTINSGEPCHILNIEFSFERQEKTPVFVLGELLELSNDLKFILEEKPLYKVLSDENGSISKVMPLLLQELAVPACSDRDNLVNSLLLLFLNYLGRLYTYQSEKTLYISHVRKAIHYIHERYDSDINISDIADHINLNHSYLQRIFKKYVGESIISYITRLRIEKAVALLENTTFPIIDIAVSVGFNNRQNFSCAFQKLLGVNAREYRDNYLKTQKHLSYVGHNNPERNRVILTRDGL